MKIDFEEPKAAGYEDVRDLDEEDDEPDHQRAANLRSFFIACKNLPQENEFGMESKRRCTLPEPSPSEVERLHRELQRMGFKTYHKAEYKYRDVF